MIIIKDDYVLVQRGPKLFRSQIRSEVRCVDGICRCPQNSPFLIFNGKSIAYSWTAALDRCRKFPCLAFRYKFHLMISRFIYNIILFVKIFSCNFYIIFMCLILQVTFYNIRYIYYGKIVGCISIEFYDLYMMRFYTYYIIRIT